MATIRATDGQSPRILIVRLSAIGDVIHGMPIACALRERFPNALLAWTVEQRATMLLREHQAIDELIELPRRWLRSPRVLGQLRRRLRAMKFDIAVEAQGLTKSAIVAWLSGAKRRIGFGGRWGRELSQRINTETVETPAEHVVDRNVQLLRPLGIDSPVVRFRVPEPLLDRIAAEEMIRYCGLADGFGIMNMGAGWASKLWPAERYAAVAAHLGRERGLPTMVLWAGDEERAMAERVAAGSGGHARRAPATTLTEVAALARRATLFIGSDTGPLHLAAAVGTPCVGLYGPWPAKRHGPYGPQHIALQKMFFEGPTRQRRNAPSKYMEAIDVEDVCEACERILGRDDRNAA